LRYANSAAIGLRTKVKSIQTAVTIIGELQIKRWLCLIMLSMMADEKPQELVKLSIMRAVFCNKIGASLSGKTRDSAAFFIVGMFSLLDVLLDQPMGKILKELNLADEIQDCLLERSSGVLSQTLALVKAYEQGNWDDMENLAKHFGLDSKKLPAFFQEVITEVTSFGLDD